jgi:hypothetical protein
MDQENSGNWRDDQSLPAAARVVPKLMGRHGARPSISVLGADA